MRNDRERFADILEAAQKIQSRVDRGRERFDADEDMQIALTHLLQVIGEAAARVSSNTTARYPTVPWRQIVGMRNRVVHDYFEVDLEIRWVAVTIDVPRLARDIERIVGETRPSDE